MEFWTNLFEFSAVILFLYILVYVIKAKEFSQLSTLIAGFIFGVVLEYVNIYLTGVYVYSQHFILQVGVYPNNVPLCIAISWGMLILSIHNFTANFSFPILLRSVFEAFFVVSVDLFLDVVAVRLGGGFWTWKSFSLTYQITTTALYGIPWGNFSGWYIVIFAISLFLHIFDKKKPEITAMILIIRTIAAVIFSELFLLLFEFGIQMPVSLLALDFLPFILCYTGSIVLILWDFMNSKSQSHKVINIMAEKMNSPFPFIYFVFSYLYVIISMSFNGMWAEIPLYISLALIFAIGSIYSIGRKTDWKKLKWM